MYTLVKISKIEYLERGEIMKLNLPIIKEKRKAKGFNIDKMAELLGLTNGSMYWKRENGDYKFKAEEVMMLSSILEIPIENLFLSDEYSKTEIPQMKKIV